MRTVEQIKNDLNMTQNLVEAQRIFDKVKALNPKLSVEIGCQNGGTLQMWSYATNGFLVAIDTVDNVYWDKFDKRNNFLQFIKGNSQLAETCEQLEIFMEANKLDAIDFLFIDGDHEYGAVCKDFEMYAPLVRRGGVIAFHDLLMSKDKSEGVSKLFEEIKNNYKYEEIISHPGAMGIGLLYV